MATVKLADVVVPEEFTAYQVQNSMARTALVEAGIMTRNAFIEEQLRAGAESFTVPRWLDLGDAEANLVNDDPDVHATPRNIGTDKMRVRKAFLHGSFAAMNLASELSGDDAMVRIQNRVNAWWNRQMQKRLVYTLEGLVADNVANNDSDMVLDISAETGDAAKFSAKAVIRAAGTMGDALNDVVGIAMHSDTYQLALENDLIAFEKDSTGSLLLPTFRGLAVTMDDAMPVDDVTGVYTTALFGRGAVGYGATAPRIAEGTEIENDPSAGNGGGQQILHTRMNVAIAPIGYRFDDTTVAAESPSWANLADPQNWTRVGPRKSVPMAFLKHTL